MKTILRCVITFVFLLLLSPVFATIYTVTNTSDAGAGSLRQAITNANANSGADEIRFNIGGAAPYTISVASALPAITESVIINGMSQPGSWNNDNANRNITIYITTASASSFNALNFSGTVSSIEIYGVAIGGFKGAAINAATGATINTLFVWGCFFGTMPNGTTTNGNDNDIVINTGVNIQRLQVGVNSDNNGAWREANLFAATRKACISVRSPITTAGIIAGNYFGVLKDGATVAKVCTAAAAETGAIELINSSRVTVGTNADGADDWAEYNVISNTDMGAASAIRHLSHGVFINNASQIWVSGNFIGTDVTGELAKSNYGKGVQVSNSSTIFIGYDDAKPSGNAWATLNIIAANKAGGIGITNAQNLAIANNYIGTNKFARVAMGNGDNLTGTGDGIYASGNNSNIIIGCDGDNINDDKESNYICSSVLNGINATGPNYKISGNSIGINFDKQDLGNGANGILLTNSRNTLIGNNGSSTQDEYEQNFIGGNGNNGVRLISCNKTAIAGNYIGSVNDGPSSVLPNDWHGLHITDSDSCTIGSNANSTNYVLQRNHIICNGSNGVLLNNVNYSFISNNFIGVGSDGALVRSNQANGLELINCKRDTIGTNGDLTNDHLERNIISSNGGTGIYINSAGVAGSHPHFIANNFIGATSAGIGTLTSGNGDDGIYIANTPNMIIGTNSDGRSDNFERNVITGNVNSGLQMINCVSAIIANNFIGAASSGALGNGNGLNGLSITACHFSTIGTNGNGVNDAGERNVISNNKENGIGLYSSDNMTIANNYIGVASWGGDDWGNFKNGIEIDGCINITIGTNGDNASDFTERNVISSNREDGVLISNTTNVTIANNYIGVASWGFQDFGNDKNGIETNNCSNITIGTSGNGISDEDERNVIGHNTQAGISLVNSFTAVIANNYLGQSSDDALVCPNNNGLELINSYNNRIGSNTDGVSDNHEVNIISGNTNYGVLVSGSNAYNNIFTSNRIGITKWTDNARPNNDAAVVFEQEANNNRIGSDGDNINDNAEINIIANNGKGVIVKDNSTLRNRISKNSFYDNGSSAIDLGNFDGVTPNDGVVNATANNTGLDYPVIVNSVLTGSNNLRVTGYIGNCSGAFDNPGTVISNPLTVEVYESDNTPADQDGAITANSCGNLIYPHGEGRTYLGSFTVSTGIFTNRTITTAVPITNANNITAIAIDANGNTSEFGPVINLVILENGQHIFTVLAENNTVVLNYKSNLTGIKNIITERSTDGINWIVCATGNETKSNQLFTATDFSPLTGKNFYRLQFLQNDGLKKYSTVKSIHFKSNESKTAYTVYPTVVNDNVTVRQNSKLQTLSIEVLNSNGTIIKKYTTSLAQYTITDMAILPAGIYAVRISNKEAIETFKIIVQR
jgi:hypothetical protein